MSANLNSKVYLVTGASSGVGLETARQLSLQQNTRKVYLACRNRAKLEKVMEAYLTKHPETVGREKFAYVPFDASEEKLVVTTNALDAIPRSERFDALIFNAGGVGNDKTGRPSGSNNVTEVARVNVFGNVHLLEALMSRNHLKPYHTTIVCSGSEAARGVSIMKIPAPKLPDSVGAYQSMLTGELFREFDAFEAYASTKALAALYWAAWARKHPEYYVLTVSPGGTKGTNLAKQNANNRRMKMVRPVLMRTFFTVGLAHDVEFGARRYVDAVNHSGPFDNMESGTFVASVSGLSGPVGDQREHRRGQAFGDIAKQEAAFKAVRSFV